MIVVNSPDPIITIIRLLLVIGFPLHGLNAVQVSVSSLFWF